jgi:hypothetical protein
MCEIDEFKVRLPGEVKSAKERVRKMQDQAAEEYRKMQANYAKFLHLSHRIQEAMQSRVEAFEGSLPDVTRDVTERAFGPAGRVFHGVFVTFSTPRGERCATDTKLRFGLETGADVDSLVLFYELESLPAFFEFERRDQVVLPLDPSIAWADVAWFERKALAFTKTYVSLFLDPEYQKRSQVADVVLGRAFPRAFAKSRAKYRGATYHFLTEKSWKPFEQDPSRCVGNPQ